METAFTRFTKVFALVAPLNAHSFLASGGTGMPLTLANSVLHVFG